MKLLLHRVENFNADFDRQYRWYLEQAGEELAERFLKATLATLHSLADRPDLGRRRKFRNIVLGELRSFRINPPFDQILVFYRVSEGTLEAWRLMHGARDLPRRLAEPPRSE